jgi:glutaredoxin
MPIRGNMLIVYSKNNCSACSRAKDLLKLKGIEFVAVNTDEDFEAFDFIIAKGHRTFPQIYKDNGEIFVEGGFEGLRKHFEEELKSI